MGTFAQLGPSGDSGAGGAAGPGAPGEGSLKVFSPGAWVAVSGVGARKVLDVGPDGAVTYREVEKDAKSVITLRPAEAQRRIRPLVSVEVAEALRDSLDDAPAPNLSENEYERSSAYKAVLKANDLAVVVKTLKGIYGHPKPGYPEEQQEDLLAEVAFSELGVVLRVKPSTLKTRARKASGLATLPDRSSELAGFKRLPALPGHEPIGAFYVERALIADEWGYGKPVPARPGVWFGYVVDPGDPPDDDDECAELRQLVCVHSDVIADYAALRAQLTLEPHEEVPIDGGGMAVVDADAAEDPSFRRALHGWAGRPVLQHHGVAVETGGDGWANSHYARVDGLAVLVCVEY